MLVILILYVSRHILLTYQTYGNLIFLIKANIKAFQQKRVM